MSSNSTLVAKLDHPKRRGRPRKDATAQGPAAAITPIVPHQAPSYSALDVNTVHAGNFIELAAALPDKSVDIIIADPPYNASKGNIWSMQHGTLPGFGGNWQKIAEVWDDMPLEKYLAFTLSWLADANRMGFTKQQASR